MSGPAARPGHGITVESCGSEIERNTSRTSERSGNVGTIWALFESATPRKPPLGPVAGRILELSKPFEGRVFRILRAAFDPTEPLPPIRESFWRNHLAECTQTRQGHNFRQTWQMAHNAGLHFQVACERMEGKQAQVSDRVQKELKKVVQVLDLLRDAIEDLSKVTRDLLEEAFDRPAMGGTARIQQKFAIEDPLDHVLAWLAILKTTVERPQIEIKRGRDEAPKRALVGGLAELYRVMTGKEPGRVYLPAKSPGREAGDFLELVRTFVGYANAVPPQDVICGTISLSKVVRQELKKRKVACPD